MRAIAVAALCLAASSAWAQQPSNRAPAPSTPSAGAPSAAACEKLSLAYEGARRSIIFTQARIHADDSIPRITRYEIQVQQHLIAQQMNLTLMVQQRCALPATPASNDPDPAKSLECGNQMMEAKLGKRAAGNWPACKFE